MRCADLLAGYGEILPMPNTPVRFFEYMTYDQHGLRRTELKIDDESGSPFMTVWQRAPHSKVPLMEGARYPWHLDEVPLGRREADLALQGRDLLGRQVDVEVQLEELHREVMRGPAAR